MESHTNTLILFVNGWNPPIFCEKFTNLLFHLTFFLSNYQNTIKSKKISKSMNQKPLSIIKSKDIKNFIKSFCKMNKEIED